MVVEMVTNADKGKSFTIYVRSRFMFCMQYVDCRAYELINTTPNEKFVSIFHNFHENRIEYQTLTIRSNDIGTFRQIQRKH